MKFKAKRRLAKGRGLTSKPLKKNLPAVTTDGEIMVSAGKFAREAVLTVFQQIGGVDAMAVWAEANKESFYTKMFSKTITRQIEDVANAATVEDLLAKLDEQDNKAKETAVDADFEDVK